MKNWNVFSSHFAVHTSVFNLMMKTVFFVKAGTNRQEDQKDLLKQSTHVGDEIKNRQTHSLRSLKERRILQKWINSINQPFSIFTLDDDG